jgi:hypothetical protein
VLLSTLRSTLQIFCRVKACSWRWSANLVAHFGDLQIHRDSVQYSCCRQLAVAHETYTG